MRKAITGVTCWYGFNRKANTTARKAEQQRGKKRKATTMDAGEKRQQQGEQNREQKAERDQFAIGEGLRDRKQTTNLWVWLLCLFLA